MHCLVVGDPASVAFAIEAPMPDARQVTAAGEVTSISNIQTDNLFADPSDGAIPKAVMGAHVESGADVDLGAKVLQIVIAHQISQPEDKRLIDRPAVICRLRLVNRSSASQLENLAESQRIVDEIRTRREKFSDMGELTFRHFSQLLDSVLRLGQKYQNLPLQALARFVASISPQHRLLSEKEKVLLYERMASAVGQLSRGYRTELGGILDVALTIKKEVGESDKKSVVVEFDRWAFALLEAIESKVMDSVAKFHGAGWRRIAERYGLISGEVAELEKKIADGDLVFRDCVRGVRAEDVRKKYDLPAHLSAYLMRKSFDAGSMKEALITGKIDCRIIAKRHGIEEDDIPDYMWRFANDSKSLPLAEEVLHELRRSPGNIMWIDRRHEIADLELKRRMMEVAAIFRVRSYVLAADSDSPDSSQLHHVADDALKFTWWYIQALPTIQRERELSEAARACGSPIRFTLEQGNSEQVLL